MKGLVRQFADAVFGGDLPGGGAADDDEVFWVGDDGAAACV